jgi:hypothetical protein
MDKNREKRLCDMMQKDEESGIYDVTVKLQPKKEFKAKLTDVRRKR